MTVKAESPRPSEPHAREQSRGKIVDGTRSATVGVLFVHGIGNHKEGETLSNFGDPLIDWLRTCLSFSNWEPRTGAIEITEVSLAARSTETPSPAYVAFDAIGKKTDDGPIEREAWLFAEAWWGGIRHPPVSIDLLFWLFTRGPLVIFWHYLSRDQRLRGPRLPQLVKESLLTVPKAVVLATVVQLSTLVGIALWTIPIGPWRKGLAAAIRYLTLTLGDSFSLLEKDICRAAFVDRVASTIEWISQRASRIVVVAHSQGAAIASEALQKDGVPPIAHFISVGSGLEKLTFLQTVRRRRMGLLAASLPGFLLCLGIVATLGGRASAHAGKIAFVLALLVSFVLLIDFARYDSDIRKELGNFRRNFHRWTDVYATNDLVPMGENSMFNGTGWHHLTDSRREVVNERSYLADHNAYFRNTNEVLPLLWELFTSGDLFSDGEYCPRTTGVVSRAVEGVLETIKSLAREHRRHVAALTWVYRTVGVFALIYLVRWTPDVQPFGTSIRHALGVASSGIGRSGSAEVLDPEQDALLSQLVGATAIVASLLI
jgi:hypothetical protein